MDGSARSDVNENSLVVMLELAGTRILLPGDSGGGGRATPKELPETGSVEDALLQCCGELLAADILVLGHRGSMTSSRELFVRAVGARDYIVSSGPMPYSGTLLPDEDVLDLVSAQPGASLHRTDEADDLCRTDPSKIGADNDGRPGGCNTIHVRIEPGGPYEIATLDD